MVQRYNVSQLRVSNFGLLEDHFDQFVWVFLPKFYQFLPGIYTLLTLVEQALVYINVLEYVGQK